MAHCIPNLAMARAEPRARPNPPDRWEGLSDEVVIAVCARAPFLSHGTIRCVSRRLNALLSSPAFREERIEAGFAERAVVVAGGFRGGGPTAECWLYAGGRWLAIAPMSGCLLGGG